MPKVVVTQPASSEPSVHQGITVLPFTQLRDLLKLPASSKILRADVTPGQQGITLVIEDVTLPATPPGSYLPAIDIEITVEPSDRTAFSRYIT